jgi:SRSO17 transposase
MSEMSVQQITGLGRRLSRCLCRFRDCLARSAGRALLPVYVQGPMSMVQRRNVEAMALDQGIAPRTLQRLLESIAWDHHQLRDRCHRIVADEHAHPEAIGCIDETGSVKSGPHTGGVKRQYNGSRGKIENCVNTVALSYSAPGFSVLLDAQLYLPEEWAADPVRRKQVTSPTMRSLARSHRSPSL